jgi:PAS domain S-box-containing protein
VRIRPSGAHLPEANVRQLAQQADDEEASFHALVDAITDYAIFRLDAHGVIATWNVGAHRVKGYSADEAIGAHFSMFYTAEDRAAGKPEHILEVVRSQGRYAEEGWRVRKDGTRFWAGVVLTPLLDEQGQVRGFAKVTRDLTERREAEAVERQLVLEQAARAVAEDTRDRLEASQRDAERAVRRAEESNRLKDEFLATVSHELRTPLNAILGWGMVLEKRLAGTPLESGVEAICRNARAQARLIEDILDVSRIITGKLRISAQKIDLVEVIGEAMSVVKPSAQAKNIDFGFAHEEASIKVVGDAERLHQVVWNLLSNAIKFTDEGGSVRVSLRRSADGRAVLRVADSGHGIAPEFLPYVFDRFRQQEAGTTRRLGGLGLGLAIVRHIVELHGGSVAAHSPGEGRGASFDVIFPIHALVEPEATFVSETAHARPESRRERFALDGITVLIIDDDRDSREVLAETLTDAGADVSVAESAQQGFASYVATGPSVVVSDIAMPDEDGYSFARRIRAHQAARGIPPTPLIALSAFTRVEDKLRAEQAGFSAHVSKPIVANELVNLIAKVSAQAS